ncbi:hypothetical protein GCM10010140_77020 [Streptosporangium pseudovulgare]|uniref:Uncharacterized protein n=1 Tax=Streptosporangium pseudovulgare TaxID=35765 RepID=A0ABQ2RLQ9_9ACTN|nr:hypothetical protein GCM10010140_77020 [Streptosporangium pseudovulgare]
MVTARTWRDKSGTITITGAFSQVVVLDICLYVNPLALSGVLGLWAYIGMDGTGMRAEPLPMTSRLCRCG